MSAIEITGAVLGISGTALLALNTSFSKWAWVFWLGSTAFIFVVALNAKLYGVATMQGTYFFFNSIGCWKWLIRPALDTHQSPLLEKAGGG